MSPTTFHHVGIVVPDREQVEHYVRLLGVAISCDEYVEAFDCDCVFLGDSIPCVELVIPRGGPLKAFNDGAGGLHHCAFRTADLVQFMREFAQGKGRWLHPSPVKGARGMLVNFVAPGHLGTLTEFVQEGL